MEDVDLSVRKVSCTHLVTSGFSMKKAREIGI